MLPKPKLRLEPPRGRPIQILLTVGGIGDALCLWPAIRFCWQGHPKSKRILSIPRKHHWLYEKEINRAVHIIDANKVSQSPSLVFDNEWIVKQELAELKEHKRLLSRARRLSSLAGNSLIISHKPYKLPRKPVECEKRPLIAVNTIASNPSRTLIGAVSLFSELRDFGTVINLSKKKNSKFVYGPKEMVNIISNCDLLVSVDSAPLHIANAYGKRVVLLAGYTAVPGLYDYDNRKVLTVTGDCPKDSLPCLWDISCLSGTRGEKEQQEVPCMKIRSTDILKSVNRQLRSGTKILVVMLTWNNLKLTRMALESIDSFYDTEVLVIDNGSTDGTAEFVKKSGYKFISLPRTSVAQALNHGLRVGVEQDFDYIFVMNNDVVLCNDYLDKAVETMLTDGRIGLVTGDVREKGDPTWISEVPRRNVVAEFFDIARGGYSATLFRAEAVKRTGLFDENYKPRYIEDNDYNLRMNLQGFKTCRDESIVFWHYVGATHKLVLGVKAANADGHWEKNINYFKKKWGSHPHRHSQADPVFRQPFGGDEVEAGKYGIDKFHRAFA